MTPLFVLDELIACGWGETPQFLIPPDWFERPGPAYDTELARKARGDRGPVSRNWRVRRVRYLARKRSARRACA